MKSFKNNNDKGFWYKVKIIIKANNEINITLKYHWINSFKNN